MSLDNVLNSAKNRASEYNENISMYDSNIVYLDINDNSHLNNHLNYLFRTDSNQKWTNDLTNKNIYIFPQNDLFSDISFAKNLDERVCLKDRTKRLIREKAKAENKKLDVFVQKVKQTRIDYRDDSVFVANKKVVAETYEVLNTLKLAINGFELFCAVIHSDQKENYVHLHVLYSINE